MALFRNNSSLVILDCLPARVRQMVEVLVEHAAEIESPNAGQVTLHFCRDTAGQERPIVADVQMRIRLPERIAV